MEAKTCLECGDAIKGRADKKFCSDLCRNSFNNKHNRDANNYIRNVNNILRKNRRILAELNPKGKMKASRNTLTDKGFNFNYFTSTYTTKTGNTYYFCYEQGYLELENDQYALVIKQEYAK
jgi:predicted nucleic acid-binding Zn ribbon protein